MSKEIRLKKGVNINLKGKADKVYASVPNSKNYCIKPTDFHNLIPKLDVEVGDKVLAGSPLFHDKKNADILFTSPVSGKIIEINRGAKRVIEEIIISADKEIKYIDFGKKDPKKLSRKEIIEKMLQAGVWPFIRQRPFSIIANPNEVPKSIFISSFNSAPLAIDNDFALHGLDEAFQKGLDIITKLTDKKTHINIDGNTVPSTAFTNANRVQLNKIYGPHPSGNVGVQIHHIDPIKKGEVVWYLEPQDILIIGKLFNTGFLDATRTFTLSGSQVIKPRYYTGLLGSSISNIVKENIKKGLSRYISGDILTGNQIRNNGYLGFYHTQITVIPEGNNPDFFGWLRPATDKFSMSRAVWSWLLPKKEFELDTNMRGEERAYVMSGEYEKTLPMDIYPVHLIKSIMIDDIEQMENLGIYEVAPEDFALCEVVCTSKMPVQKIIREGLDLVLKECS